MTNFSKTIMLTSLLIVGTAWAVKAQPQNCAPIDAVNERLADQYGETLQTLATAQSGQTIVSQYANPETGTWTLLLVSPEGVACLVASGENWQLVQAELLKGASL